MILPGLYRIDAWKLLHIIFFVIFLNFVKYKKDYKNIFYYYLWKTIIYLLYLWLFIFWPICLRSFFQIVYFGFQLYSWNSFIEFAKEKISRNVLFGCWKFNAIWFILGKIIFVKIGYFGLMYFFHSWNNFIVIARWKIPRKVPLSLNNWVSRFLLSYQEMFHLVVMDLHQNKELKHVSFTSLV